jgi:hypothetical protein
MLSDDDELSVELARDFRNCVRWIAFFHFDNGVRHVHGKAGVVQTPERSGSRVHEERFGHRVSVGKNSVYFRHYE